MSFAKQYVVFDIDGVLADFAYSWSRVAASMFRIPVTSTLEQEKFKLSEELLLSKDDEQRVWAKIEASPDFWYNIPCLLSEYDKRALHMLSEEWVTLIYLTNRHETGTVRDQTERWLKEHGLPEGHLVFTKDKDLYLRERMLEAGKPVLRLDGELRQDPGTLIAVIEDNPRNLSSYERGIASWYARPVVYVIARTYNEHASYKLPRVGSVLSFCDKVLYYIEAIDYLTGRRRG